MSQVTSHREIEEGLERDFTRNLSSGVSLDLERLLSARHTRAQPPQHWGVYGLCEELVDLEDLTFFPEMFEVRSRIQDVAPAGYHDHVPGGQS